MRASFFDQRVYFNANGNQIIGSSSGNTFQANPQPNLLSNVRFGS
jgi:hypothetical protein